MEEIKKLVEEILSKGYVMSLATLDDGGIWVSDVVYVFDRNFNIYWISQVSTRHSKAIEENSKIAATITTSVHGGKNEGLQIEGKAEKVEMVQSSGHRILDEAALTAIREWYFTPGHIGGLEVASWVTIPIRFAIKKK